MLHTLTDYYTLNQFTEVTISPFCFFLIQLLLVFILTSNSQTILALRTAPFVNEQCSQVQILIATKLVIEASWKMLVSLHTCIQ